MLLSRGTRLLKNVYRFSGTKSPIINLKQTRNVWCYRTAPPPDKTWVILTEIFGGIMWWWVLWNMWHDYGHIVGHFEYPKPYQWSDEDLGIPPD